MQQSPGWSRGGPREAGRPKRRFGLVIFVALVGALAVAGALLMKAGPMQLVAQQICPGRVEVDVRRYSYKPGQQGTDYRFLCVQGDKRHDITDRTINLTLAGIAVMVLGAIGVGAAFTLVRRRRAAKARG